MSSKGELWLLKSVLMAPVWSGNLGRENRHLPHLSVVNQVVLNNILLEGKGVNWKISWIIYRN